MKIIFYSFLLNFFALDFANAYVGLGPLIPVLGGAITFILVILIAFLGIIAYPVKKFLDYRKNKKNLKKDNNKVNQI